MTTKIMKLPDVIKATGLSRSSIYSFIKQNIFPQQIHLGKRAVGWAEGEITDWINQKMETRGVK